MSHGVRGGVRAARAEPRRDEVVRAWPRLSVVLVADLVATEGLLRRQQDADVGDMRSDDALVVVLEEERRVAQAARPVVVQGVVDRAHGHVRDRARRDPEKVLLRPSLPALLRVAGALNLGVSLKDLQHFEEAKSLLRRKIAVARRVLGDVHDLTLKMRLNYAEALYEDDRATLDDLREAVTTLVESERTARRVFGSAHPLTEGIERDLQTSRATLRARETPSGK